MVDLMEFELRKNDTADYAVSLRKSVIARLCGYVRRKNNTKITLLREREGCEKLKLQG